MSVRAIIHKHTDGRLSARPEYYSGRGVNRGDLGPKHIKMVYDGIVAELGNDAAEEFVKMLNELKDMSATGFLNSLYRLEASGFKFDAKNFNRSGDGIAFNDEATAFCTVASVLMGRRDPDIEEMSSRQLVAEFLFSVGRTPTPRKSKSGMMLNVNGYYTTGGIAPYET